MTAHDLLDGLAGLVGVVKGDGADIVVQNVGLDDPVEQLAADEAEFTIDRGRGTASVSPGGGGVVRQGWIGVLQESDGH